MTHIQGTCPFRTQPRLQPGYSSALFREKWRFCVNRAWNGLEDSFPVALARRLGSNPALIACLNEPVFPAGGFLIGATAKLVTCVC